MRYLSCILGQRRTPNRPGTVKAHISGAGYIDIDFFGGNTNAAYCDIEG
jgi:hypothetical protein